MIDVEVANTFKDLSITLLGCWRLHDLVQDEVDVRLMNVILHQRLLQLRYPLFQTLIHGSEVKKVS